MGKCSLYNVRLKTIHFDWNYIKIYMQKNSDWKVWKIKIHPQSHHPNTVVFIFVLFSKLSAISYFYIKKVLKSVADTHELTIYGNALSLNLDATDI